ncbi:hypothetical protein BsWGS_24486 [Bradybaena similaris]
MTSQKWNSAPKGMKLKTSNGMDLKMAHGMKLKSSNGMKLKSSNGMELKSSKGMALLADDNYIKFNEYERARKYLQMGSHIPRAPKQKLQDKEEKAVIVPARIRKIFHPRKKWRKALVVVSAVSAFRGAAERRKYRLLHFPIPAYSSRGTVMRTLTVFQQMLNV